MTDAKWGGARVGAGRKPREAGSPRKAISVTLSQAAYAALRSHAEERGCSLSEACEALIMRGGPWELAAVVPAAQGTEVDA